MKISATVSGNLASAAVRTGVVETVSRGVVRRLALELEDELRFVRASGRAADPEARRDALERAVRRHLGATL